MSETTVPASAHAPYATLRHDPVSHYHWLDFGGFPGPEAHALMKSNGWRWSRYREQYFTNRRFATPPTGIAYEDEGECLYSAERAGRLEFRADKHQEAANAAYDRSNALVANIPLGQPILRGHHSEGMHRSALKRSRAAMDKCVEEQAITDDLRQRAQASRRHQQQRVDVGKMVRRRDKLAADLRTMERNKARYAQETDLWTRVTTQLQTEIAELQTEIDAAGGEPGTNTPEGKAPFKVGDMIRIHGFVGVVKSFGSKKVTVMARDDWPLTLDRSYFQGIVATAEYLAEQKAAQQEQAGKAAQ